MRADRLWRGARRRLLVGGVAVALTLGGGGSLLAVALSNGPAGADTTLGGFTVSALAEAASVTYEQPNFPFPTDPTFEFDEGYADTTDNYGPTGTATASVIYPGEIIANAGPELSLLVPGVPVPPAPIWPLEAVSDFPQTPNSGATDEPGVNMDTSSSANGNTALATFGDDAPAAGSPGSQAGVTTTTGAGGNPLAASSALLGIGGISSTSSSGAPGTTANGTATATDSGISILDGFITIGAVTSTATATSDGTTGSVTGSTLLTNVSVAGTPVTIDANGIEADGKTEALAAPISTLNSLLKELGISLAVTSPVDTVNGAQATRTLDGLRITIDLTTLDAAANKIGSLLPASLSSKLPVPLPDEQVIGIYLGTVTASAAASPAFVDDITPSGTTGTSDFSTPPSGFTSPTSAGSFDSGSGFTGGTVTTPGIGTTTGTQPSGATPGGTLASGAPASAVTPVFKGIGTGLILLGLAMAAALAYAYKRVDDTSELVGPACSEGDPLSDRFSDAGVPFDDAGDFGP